MTLAIVNPNTKGRSWRFLAFVSIDEPLDGVTEGPLPLLLDGPLDGGIEGPLPVGDESKGTQSP